jgi:TolB-like protein/class 3 adenylate cyclase/Flp pilus assembly protein TadD
VGPEQVKRKLAVILAADVAGYSRLTGADEERTMARLRALRSDLIDPILSIHHGRVVKRTGDGAIVEFRSVVDAVRCAIEVQNGMVERNAGLPPERRIEFRIGIHLGDVVEESDGDLMGDGINIAARLEGVAAPGGISLSEDAYRQVRDRLKEEFVDLGDRALKNIARPVRVYSVTTGSGASSPAAPTAHIPRLSIVILPFANLGGDKEQDYFVEGITENLTTDLSRISGAFVIARNTASTYKGKAVDARQIGRELGVRYVMEGSVQSGRDRIRVNAQLIDAESGAHLWAERFDKPRADLFEMQDEITSRLARAVGFELIAAESSRAERERPTNMDAVDLTMRGRAILNRRVSVAGAREARTFFEAALQLEDRNISALNGLAATYCIEVGSYCSDDPAAHLRLADAAISKALALAPKSVSAHRWRGELLELLGAPEQALREFELTIALDPNFADARARAGLVKIFLGRAEETEAAVAEAIRLSPRDRLLGWWVLYIGAADLCLGRLDQAVDRLRKSVEINPNNELPYVFLAAALSLAGRDAEAAQACAAGLRLAPNFTIAKHRSRATGDNPVYLAQRERIYEGMRKAGVPVE